MTRNLVAFSGGKDSTATALLLWERGEDFDLFFTPTGNELPDLDAHIQRVLWRVQKPLIVPPNRSLQQWIEYYGALPNHRQRWCTRQIKIVPCIAYLKRRPGTVLCVGLRADEEQREGLYGEHATYRYPLRENGLGLQDVLDLCRRHDLMPPDRTDCAVCPFQRLGELYRLWKDHPEHWKQGEAWEAQTGFTFRSGQRDSWPAAMADLRERFERGDVPERSLKRMERENRCRVCAG